jgi:hypothetical protein
MTNAALSDDTWYSLSPHHIEISLPQWKKWHTRSRFLPPERPLSKSFNERLDALKRYALQKVFCMNLYQRLCLASVSIPKSIFRGSAVFEEETAVIFELCSRYKEEWRDCLVPRRYWEDWKLGVWVADARTAFKEKRLSPGQMKALEDVQFQWNVHAVSLCLVHNCCAMRIAGHLAGTPDFEMM